jgi:hypothetical protein
MTSDMSKIDGCLNFIERPIRIGVVLTLVAAFALVLLFRENAMLKTGVVVIFETTAILVGLKAMLLAVKGYQLRNASGGGIGPTLFFGSFAVATGLFVVLLVITLGR